MINKTQIVEFKRIFTLLTHQSEEDTLRIDKSIEFYKERDFLVNILLKELALRTFNISTLYKSDPTTKVILDLFVEIVILSPSLKEDAEYAIAFELRFEEYLFGFDTFLEDVLLPKATSNYIDNRILKMSEKLDVLTEDALRVDNKLEEYCILFANYKKAYYCCIN